MALRFQFPAALAAALFLAACAGGHGAAGFAPQALAPSAASIDGQPATVAMTYSIKIPAPKGAAATAAQRHENFVSASTQSIAFGVYKSGKPHTPANLISSNVVALNVGAKGCAANKTGARTCTGTLELPPPTVDIVATTYDLKPAGKKISKRAKALATASIAHQAVAAGKKLAFTLGGIPATFTMTIPSATVVGGVQTARVYGMASSSSNISVRAYDADGNLIVTDAYVDAAGKSTGVAMSVKPSHLSCTTPVLQADANKASTHITVSAPPKIGVFFNYGMKGIAAAFSTAGYCSFEVAASLGSNPVQHASYVLDGPQLNEYLISSASSPSSIVVGPDNNIWFTDTSSVGTINVTTKAIVSYPILDTNPYGIVSNAGSLWIDGFGHFIQMSTAGAILNDFAISTGHSPNSQMVLGPDGNFWFGEVGENVAKVSPTGAVTEYPVGVPSPSPQGIASAGGQLWFTSYFYQGISSITTSGVQKHYTFAPQLYPGYMTAGPDGKLWFASCQGTMTRVAIPKTGGTLAPTTFTVPGSGRVRSVGAGPNDDMWGADAAGNLDRVPLTATDSSQVTAVKVSGMAQWLTTGPDGAIWFTEETSTGNGEIGRLVP